MFFTIQRGFLSGLRLISFYASLATFAILASCGSDTDKKQTDSALSSEKMSIVVTTTHLNDIVSRIVEDRFKVVPLMGPGVDPHLYRPTSRDALAISNADLIVFHGMMLEGKLAKEFRLTMLPRKLTQRKSLDILNLQNLLTILIRMFGLILQSGPM
jgi:ABC-type Zn uptake system ZnuABC Zn-binding protein ZnuA